MINYSALQTPRELAIGVNCQLFDEPVAAVEEHLNTFTARRFLDMADNAPVESNGMRYMVVGGGKDQSTESVIVMPGMFGNGVWPQGIAAAEAISYLSADAGLHDRVGNIIPVLLTGSPSMKSRFGLSGEELNAVQGGDFSPIALRHIRLAQKLGYGSIGGFVGYSGGAAQAEPFVSAARNEFDDIGSVIIGEPPQGTRRGLLRSALGFASAGIDFKRELADENLSVINDIFASGLDSPDFERGILSQRAENLAIVRGFKRADLVQDLVKLDYLNMRTLLLHAGASLVAPSRLMRGAYDGAVINPAVTSLRRIEVMGTDHSLGDRVGRFATLVAAQLAIEQ